MEMGEPVTGWHRIQISRFVAEIIVPLKSRLHLDEVKDRLILSGKIYAYQIALSKTAKFHH